MGIAFNLTRAVSVIWVNRRATSDVGATVLSCSSQADSFGEIVGSELTMLANAADMRAALLAAAPLLALAGVTLTGFSAERAPLAGHRRGIA